MPASAGTQSTYGSGGGASFQGAIPIQHFINPAGEAPSLARVRRASGQYRRYLMTQQPPIFELSEEEIIDYACSVLEQRLAYRLSPEGITFSSTTDTKRYLILKLAELEREVFVVLFLDNRHRLIKYEEMFFGTIDSITVHPRVVVKTALGCNAASVIFGHNHPSGDAEPSNADKSIADHLRQALQLVGIRILDHIVVGGVEALSFAELGLI
jgi:DNA repair protein RadC